MIVLPDVPSFVWTTHWNVTGRPTDLPYRDILVTITITITKMIASS